MKLHVNACPACLELVVRQAHHPELSRRVERNPNPNPRPKFRSFFGQDLQD